MTGLRLSAAALRKLLAMVVLGTMAAAAQVRQSSGCTGCTDWCTVDCPATCTGVSNNHTIWTAAPTLIATVTNGKRFSAGAPELEPKIALVHVYGTAYEMGVAQGKLLSNELREFLPQAIKFIGSQISPASTHCRPTATTYLPTLLFWANV